MCFFLACLNDPYKRNVLPEGNALLQNANDPANDCICLNVSYLLYFQLILIILLFCPLEF